MVVVRQSATPSPCVSTISPPSSTSPSSRSQFSSLPAPRRTSVGICDISAGLRTQLDSQSLIALTWLVPGELPSTIPCAVVSPAPSRQGRQRLYLFRRRLTLRSTPRTVSKHHIHAPPSDEATPRTTKRPLAAATLINSRFRCNCSNSSLRLNHFSLSTSTESSPPTPTLFPFSSQPQSHQNIPLPLQLPIFRGTLSYLSLSGC